MVPRRDARVFLLLFVVAFVPLAVLALRHTVNVPAYDQLNFNIVNIIEGALRGNLTWATFVLPHNEHLSIFTKAEIVVSASLFNWFHPVATVLAAAIIALAAAFLALQLPAELRLSAGMAVVLIVASLNQWRNVTWGFMIQHGMTVLAAVVMARAAAKPRISFSALTLISALGTLASANGLALWVVGFVLLLAQAYRARTQREWLALLTFAVISVACVWLYLAQLDVPKPAAFSLPKFVPAALNVLATPLATLVHSPAARLFMGAAVLSAALVIVFMWVRAEKRRTEPAPMQLRFVAAVVLFSLASVVMIALRRDGDVSVEIKYNTTINPLYAVVLLAAVVALGVHRRKTVLGLSGAAGVLFIAASFKSLTPALLAERFDRANAVANYVEAGLDKRANATPVNAAWRDAQRTDLPQQFGRLDRLGLLHPNLGTFSTWMDKELAALRQAEAPPASPALQISVVGAPLALEAIGFPGADERGRLPDAALLIVFPKQGSARVSVYPIAKTLQQSYDGSWWARYSLGHMSERLDIGLPAEQVDRVSVLALWLDTLQTKTLFNSTPK